MKAKLMISISILAGFLFVLGAWWTAMALEGERIARAELPDGVYMILTQDFYKTLKEEGGGSSKVYSNDHSDLYLRQIAVSTKFMVETNLQILRQQEEIRKLLQDLLIKNKK
ncbi:hypothetical protein ACFL9T_12605 [Thermodesulfobacteriota bacterium]